MALFLALDTTAERCAVALCHNGRLLAEYARDMRVGHAEHLFLMLEDILAVTLLSLRNLDAIAVATGPGSLSGIRIGVSAARGLALSLRIPACGVSVLEALAEEAAGTAPPGARIVAVNAAPRDRVHAQLFRTGDDGTAEPVSEPGNFLRDDTDLLGLVADSILVGNATDAISGTVAERRPVRGVPDLGAICRIAKRRPPDPAKRPVPLYLRPPADKPALRSRA